MTNYILDGTLCIRSGPGNNGILGIKSIEFIITHHSSVPIFRYSNWGEAHKFYTFSRMMSMIESIEYGGLNTIILMDKGGRLEHVLNFFRVRIVRLINGQGGRRL